MAYLNYSMSVRAAQAYDMGEKPKSKWTKKEILEVLESENIDTSVLKKLKSDELKNLCLKYSSWHHTSSRYNRTEFYMVECKDYDEKTIENIISNRTVKAEKAKSKEINALIKYSIWQGTRKHPKKIEIEEVVTFMSDDKMVKTENGNKQLSKIEIIKTL